MSPRRKSGGTGSGQGPSNAQPSPVPAPVPAPVSVMPLHLSQWSANKLVNPKTGKTIKENGPTYLSLKKELAEWNQSVAALPASASTTKRAESSPDRETALSIVMQNMALADQPAMAMRLTGVSRALRDQGTTLRVTKPEARQVISDQTLREMIAEAIAMARTWRSYQPYQYVLTPATIETIRERAIKVLDDIWKFVKWPKSMPRGDLEEYIYNKLKRYVKDVHYVRTPIPHELSKMWAETFSHTVLRSMNKIPVPNASLVQGIMMRYALPIEPAQVLARYLQASTNEYILEAIRIASRGIGHLDTPPTTITIDKTKNHLP